MQGKSVFVHPVLTDMNITHTLHLHLSLMLFTYTSCQCNRLFYYVQFAIGLCDNSEIITV